MDSESVLETGTAIVPAEVASDRMVLVCGLPSSLTYFVADLVRDMLARTHGACDVINLNNLSEVNCGRLDSLSSQALGLVEVPDAEVVNFARSGRFPIILVQQRFSDACRDFVAARDADHFDTVRTMARAQIGLNQIAEIPRSGIIIPQDGGPTEDLVMQIADLLKVPDNIWQPLVVERQFERSVGEVLDFDNSHHPDLSEMQILFERLDEFYKFDQSKPVDVWDVPIELLLEGKQPHLSATEPIELLGPTRCLTLGPYLYLPAGNWRSVLKFSILENDSANTIGFDLICDQSIKADYQFDTEESGLFEYSFDFFVNNSYSPFEVRTFLRRGSIGGIMIIRSLNFFKLL